MPEPAYSPEPGSATVVMLDGDYAIVESTAIFGAGWNVYKADTPGSSDFVKINDKWSFFTSFAAAKKWLDDYRN